MIRCENVVAYVIAKQMVICDKKRVLSKKSSRCLNGRIESSSGNDGKIKVHRNVDSRPPRNRNKVAIEVARTFKVEQGYASSTNRNSPKNNENHRVSNRKDTVRHQRNNKRAGEYSDRDPGSPCPVKDIKPSRCGWSRVCFCLRVSCLFLLCCLFVLDLFFFMMIFVLFVCVCLFVCF